MLLRNSAILLYGVAIVWALPDTIHASFSTRQEDFTQALGQEPLHFQNFNQGPPSTRNETVYQTLSSTQEYSKLTKAIDYVNEIAVLLKDPSVQITFFATPNDALRRPHKRFDQEPMDIFNSAASMHAYDLNDAIQALDELESSSKNDDHDKKKKFLTKLLQAILSYHILPSATSTEALGDSNTFATTLALPDSLGARPLRIKVSQGIYPPTPVINLYSKIVRPQVYASNGIVHGINHPLLPPPSLFQELYMVPSTFSTFTSAIQRTGLTDALDLRYIRGEGHKKGSFEGASAVTVFAPTNHAFDALPTRLRLFLFSPFGTHILKKLLEYHIVPDLVLHTDYQYNKTSESRPLNKISGKNQFDFSQLELLCGHVECHYPIKHNDIEQEFTEYLYSAEATSIYQGDNPDSRVPRDSQAESSASPTPSNLNPFEFNIKHFEEITNMSTEAYESLSPVHQQYIADFLELYDTLTTGGPSQPVEYPADKQHHDFLSGRHYDPHCMPSGAEALCHDAFVRDIPPPQLCDHGQHPPLPRPVPISSFNITIPTALTHHSIHIEVEKFNLTIPLPGPHKPHRVVTKLFVNRHALFMFDLVGLNGAIHTINQLLDPRGQRPGHPRSNYKDAGEDEYLWDDWEEWLPQWAANL